jgi:hypothetical protein
MRPAWILSSLGLTAAALISVTATPSQAAAGVIGRLDTASVTTNHYSCFADPTIADKNACLYTTSTVRVKGWALNKSTAPIQDVRAVVTGSRRVQYYDHLDSFHDYYTIGEVLSSGAHYSNQARSDVAKVYHLSSNKVGYSFTYKTPTNGHFEGSTKVCVQARDHGTSQSWRQIACRTVTAH